MIKKDFVNLFSVLKKKNSEFYIAIFNDVVSTSDFAILSKDGNLCGYSSYFNDKLKAVSKLGADDIEYIYDAVKNKDISPQADIYFSIDEQIIEVNTLENRLYYCEIKPVEKEINPPVNKLGKEIYVSEVKNKLKFISSMTDEKGYSEVPFIHIGLKDEKLILLSFNAWNASIVKFDDNHRLKNNYKVSPSDLSELLSLLPSGKTAVMSFNIIKNKMLFYFNNCEYIVNLSSETLDFNDVINLFKIDNLSIITVDNEKLKSMLSKMKGVFNDIGGAFINIRKEDENFCVIETGKNDDIYKYKVPASFNNCNSINIYAKYLKEFASKNTSKNLIISISGNTVVLSNDSDDYSLLSMDKRK